MNPKEQYHAIFMRSGRIVGKENEDSNVVEAEKRSESKDEEQVNIPTVLKEVEVPNREDWPKRKTKRQILKDSVKHDNISPYCKISYPQKLGLKKQMKRSNLQGSLMSSSLFKSTFHFWRLWRKYFPM